ncbi:MAG: hypothetical protein KTR14_09450 [Vampirovibrio sp.]|nr:hypothetical protein [Vampirovibrio sp.]
MEKKDVPFVRWHDRNPVLAEVIQKLEKMPTEHMEVCARLMIGMCSNLKGGPKDDFSLVELGAEKTTGLMKSKNKRRWYDQNPVMHMAMNKLYLLSEKEQGVIAEKMIVSIRVLEEYLGYCYRQIRKEEPQEALYLIKTGIEDGYEHCIKKLKEMGCWDEKSGKHLPEAIAKKHRLPTPEEKKNLVAGYQLQDSDQGMKINHNMFP